MNNDWQTTDPLTLFDVLVQEYEHQARNHSELKQLYAPREVEKKRKSVEEKYAHLTDEHERDRKINDQLVEDFYRRLHESGVARAALCHSGGGIRSATFGLGVLQGLANHLNLNQFHYVSTVSGGGYLGSWFSAWIHRRGMKEVQIEIEDNRANRSPLNPEPEPIFHLRRYSNYMSPRFGLLSADTWALVGTFSRNLFLNWLVLIPLMLFALALPRLWMSLLAWNEPNSVIVNIIFWIGFTFGVISIAYIIVNRPSLTNLTQKWFPQKLRSEGWFLIIGLGFLVAASLSSALYWSWIHIPVNEPIGLSLFGIEPQNYFQQEEPWGFMAFGVALHFLGFLLSQSFAPQIFKRRLYFGVRDLLYSILTGAIGGLCLWQVALAFHTPVVSNPAEQALLSAALYACIAPPIFLLMFLIAATIFVGLASYHTNDADREWLARCGGWIMIAAGAWAVFNGLVIFGPVGLIWLWEDVVLKVSLVSLGTGSGLITLIGGRSGKTSGKKEEDAKTKKPSLPVKLLELALPFAAVVFLLIFIATLSLATTALTELLNDALTVSQIPPSASWEWHLNVLYHAPNRLMIAIALLLLAVGVVMGWFVNVNKFSLHSTYRDRLIRAYLGASRHATERRPNPFTGLDEQDNLQMHDLIRPVFHPKNFVKPDVIIVRMKDGKDPVSQFIWGTLSKPARQLFENYIEQKDRTPEFAKEVMEELIDSFNRIIHGPPLHEVSPFKQLRSEPRVPELDSQIEELIARQPKVPLLTARWLLRWLQRWRPAHVEKLRINSLLLKKAYQDEIDLMPEDLNEARPLHVVNMALNLVMGEELAWQDRKAQSFTVSPLHAGSLFNIGYRRSKEYGVSQRQDGAISLGTSLAISGAAASPNMGYHSSPVVTFLMALFNVRLGWWLGNPGRAGQNTYSQPSPAFAPKALIAETLGWTDNQHPYVYLSDGGHFENLGLYEMVLRRCRYIVVTDGSQDEDCDFESLGNALSKIRTDLGVRISFDAIPISRRPHETPTYFKEGGDEKGKMYCALGVIHYSEADGKEVNGKKVEDGVLIYIKPAFYGTEPADVYNYAKANPAFPHESTADQMYSEAQFESYRALGAYIVEKILNDSGETGKKLDLKQFKEAVEKYLRDMRITSASAPAPDAFMT